MNPTGTANGVHMQEGNQLTQFFVRSLIEVPGPMYVWKPSKPSVTI